MGTRYAFDFGQCTGPYNCPRAFEEYGYFVGCNYVSEWPTAQWRHKNFYPSAIWYSLPGACSSRRYYDQDAECKVADPGGLCRNVTGQGNCTFSFKRAGELSLDEIEGIANFTEFAQMGGWEYNNRT